MLFPELNLVICRPADWKPMEPRRIQSSYEVRSNTFSGGDPRLTRAFLTSAGAPAAFVFNQYTAASRYDDRDIVDDVLYRIRRLGLVNPLPPVRFDCAGGPGDRRLLARTWRDRSGGVQYVALVFADQERPGLECQVMESIQQIIVLR